MPIFAIKKKNPQICAPLFPFAFLAAFQYDMLYGNMQIRAQKEAARMIKEEPERFFMVEGNGMLSHQEYLKIMNLP